MSMNATVNTVLKKIPKVVSTKGNKLAGKIVSAEIGTTITLVCARMLVLPVFIFPRLSSF